MSREYYGNERISQSRLKKIIVSPGAYKNNPQISGPSLILGSLFECLLLEPETFKTSYYVYKDYSVPDAVKNVWKTFFESRRAVDNFDLDEDLLDAVAVNEGYRLTQAKARLPKLLEFKKYYEELIISQGKILISEVEYNKALDMVKAIKLSPFTKDIMTEDMLIQKAIYWEFNGFKLKSLIDFAIINHKKKIIYPWDLKSTAFSTNKFKSSIYKYRYDFQAAFYTYALQSAYPDYTIDSFRFLVESTEYPGTPLIYQLSDYALKVGAFGGMVDNREYKGFVGCLADLRWHIKSNEWNYTKEQFDNKGIVIV